MREEGEGAAIVVIVSGGWFSSHANIDGGFFRHFIDEPIKRGYMVFAVCHGSQPLFTIPDAVADVNRAVRFIRYHARDYHIDLRRIGVTGGSAGGHLSLMLGVAGDNGNPRSTNAVERTSSRGKPSPASFPAHGFSQLR